VVVEGSAEGSAEGTAEGTAGEVVQRILAIPGSVLERIRSGGCSGPQKLLESA